MNESPMNSEEAMTKDTGAGAELAACPFCGGEAVLDGKSESCRVRCLNCGTEGKFAFFDDGEDEEKIAAAEAEAIAGWNRRSPVAPLPSARGAESYCRCHRCLREGDVKDESGVMPLAMTQMILCPECGNKRCPHASDHRLACTKSNEPGQPGSVYPAAPPLPPLTAPTLPVQLALDICTVMEFDPDEPPADNGQDGDYHAVMRRISAAARRVCAYAEEHAARPTLPEDWKRDVEVVRRHQMADWKGITLPADVVAGLNEYRVAAMSLSSHLESSQRSLAAVMEEREGSEAVIRSAMHQLTELNIGFEEENPPLWNDIKIIRDSLEGALPKPPTTTNKETE